MTWSGAFADFDADAYRDHFGTTHQMWTSPWVRYGVGRDRAVPRGRAIREGKARHVLNVFPVVWATQPRR